MEFCFEILVPITLDISHLEFSLPIFEWGGDSFPQGPEEACFEYFKLRKSPIPSHTASILPLAMQGEHWQCISIVEGLEEYKSELSNNPEHQKGETTTLSQLLYSLLNNSLQWVIIFEPNCDRIDEIIEGDVGNVVEEVSQSLQKEEKGFVIWQNK